MTRQKDRSSASGLLPLMEARLWKNGKTATYRYHPIGDKPINLGQEKQAAIRRVLDMNDESPERGTVEGLWTLYQDSPEWKRLASNSQADYRQCAKELLKVFGKNNPAAILPSHCARYLRVERAAAPIRANREMALLSNLMNLAVERGDIVANPCKQTRRNFEAPRDYTPDPTALAPFLEWAHARPGQAKIIASMAEFASLTGSRRVEFLHLHWPQVGKDVVRLVRAKQRKRQVVESLTISPALDALLSKLRATASNPTLGAVFPNKHGNPYTDQGFKAVWGRLVNLAIEKKVIERRFTFHDLRAYFVTQYKAETGLLPDLHANPGTTARVYDRTKEVKRRSI